MHKMQDHKDHPELMETPVLPVHPVTQAEMVTQEDPVNPVIQDHLAQLEKE